MVYLHLLARRHTTAVLWALPLMLVKEDSVFLLLGVVLVLLAQQAWRQAAALTGYALVSFGLIVGVVIPRISFTGRYTYWSSSAAGDGNPLTGALHNLVHALTSGQPELLVIVLLLPAMLALRSPLMLGVVPPLAARLTAPQESYWGPDFHYNGTITVIVAIALLDALIRRRHRRAVVNASLAWIVAAPILLLPWAPLGQLATAPACGDCHAQVLRLLDRHIPDGARVAAADTAAPYLIDRTRVYGLHQHFVDSNGRPVLPDYIVVDKVRDQGWQESWFNAQYGQIDYQLLGEAVRLGQDGLLDYDYAVLVPRDKTTNPAPTLSQLRPPPQPTSGVWSRQTFVSGQTCTVEFSIEPVSDSGDSEGVDQGTSLAQLRKAVAAAERYLPTLAASPIDSRAEAERLDRQAAEGNRTTTSGEPDPLTLHDRDVESLFGAAGLLLDAHLVKKGLNPIGVGVSMGITDCQADGDGWKPGTGPA